MATSSASSSEGPAGSPPDRDRTILFVCHHGAAKSVLAAELTERAAEQRGIAVTILAAGIDPSETVADGVLALLPDRAAALRTRRPRRVTEGDVGAAAITVSFNLTRSDLPGQPRELLAWDDVPAVSEGPEAARVAIDRHVGELLDRLGS